MKAVFIDHHDPQRLPAETSETCASNDAAGYPCNNIDLESFMPLLALGASETEEVNDIWGWTDAATGSKYALIGMTFGTAFVDISVPTAPVYLGELPTHGAFGSNWRDVKTYNDHAFIVSKAKGHGIQVFDLTQLRGLTGTRIFDVTDLDNPTLAGQYTSSEAAIDHNQYVKGDYSYQANYRAGLRILDISDVANGNLSEVGYFDVWPADNNAEFNGAWSNYPYFDSGVVIISGIEQGLFVVRPNLGGDNGVTQVESWWTVHRSASTPTVPMGGRPRGTRRQPPTGQQPLALRPPTQAGKQR